MCRVVTYMRMPTSGLDVMRTEASGRLPSTGSQENEVVGDNNNWKDFVLDGGSVLFLGRGGVNRSFEPLFQFVPQPI